MSTLEVNSIQPLSSGTTVTLGASGKTLNIPSGCTISNSGTATGFGKIGQVVSTAASSKTTTTSSSEVVAATSNSITPSSSSSKILVCAHGFVGNLRTGDQLPTFTKIYRDIGGTETQITSAKTAYSDSENVSTHFKFNNSGNANHMITNVAYTILDEPSTTSAITYKWKHRNYGGGTDIVGGVVFNLIEVLA